jgi:chromosomal replication initiator protein
MNHNNLWAATYHQILQNHQNPTEAKFWLDVLKWNKAERLGSGRVRVELTAPSVYYANFLNSAYKGTIESAVTSVLGESCEVEIHSLAGVPASNPSDTTDGLQNEFIHNITQNLAQKSAQPVDEVALSKMNDISALPSGMDSLSDPLAPPRFEAPQQPSQNEVSHQNSHQHSQQRGSFIRSESQSRIQDNLDPQLTFDKYIVGPSNQFAFASAFSTADNPAVQYNPLFIYGPPAVGKTHLLHAIGNQIKKRNPHIRAYFVSAENFVNEFIQSIQHKNPGDFRAKYRENVDLLLIDDVQFIVGKDRSEEEFIHTFNTLHSLKKMVILTSDKAPKDIDGLEERIRTRFEMGLVADIRPPEIETRIAILKAKAEQDDMYLPDEVATFLGTYVKDTVRNLHGALVKLQQFSSLTGAEITLDLAKQVLQNSIPEEGQEYTVEMILNAVCKHFGIKMKELKGASRAKVFSQPRQISIYLIRRYTTLGFREISQIFGKDHSTAVHAHKKIEQEIETDLEIRRSVESIREQL